MYHKNTKEVLELGSPVSLERQVNRLPDAPELRAALEFLCSESNKLYNNRELLSLWRRGELADKPKPPNYRTAGGKVGIVY